MTKIGTPFSPKSTKALMLGSGELGKEVALELQRYGVEITACDKYENAPAMQVSHHSYTFNMLNGDMLKEVVEKEKPSIIIPEIEAISTSTLVELEKDGYNIVPNANAAFLTMNREAIRRLAAETLGLPTAKYMFADNHDEFINCVKTIGIPCVVKPIMSSSGHGQSVIKNEKDVENAWTISQEGGRSGAGRVIIEEFIHFDYEITLLTIRHVAGTTTLQPIGHHQIDGDYRESWQPQPMSDTALTKAKQIAHDITNALGGYGIFGVEMFINGEDVIFSEVSPRPHDTGMVTMISQDLSEFSLHARAILGLPIPEVRFLGPSASKAIVIEGNSNQITFSNIENVLEEPGVQIRLFGKPEVNGHRRLGVILATADTMENALQKVERAYKKLNVDIIPR